MALSGIMAGCTPPDKYRNAVLKATEIQFYAVEADPTAPGEQKPATQYVNGFEVTKEYTLSDQQTSALKKALVSTSNYSDKDIKRCPFMARYIIKSDTAFTIMVSKSPCGKVLIPEKDGKEIIYDLVNDNSLEKTIGQIVEGAK